MYKSKLDLLAHLLTPSGLGLGIYGLASSGLLFAGASNALSSTSQFYKILLGDYASGQLIETTRQDFAHTLMFFDNPWLNNILLFVFWGVLGIVAWFLLTNTTSLFSEVGEDLKEVSYKGGQPSSDHRPLLKTLQRVSYHLVLLIIVVGYMYLVWPFLLSRITDYFIGGLGFSVTASGIFTMFMALLLLMIVLHVLTILLRLLFLRPRLLGD